MMPFRQKNHSFSGGATRPDYIIETDASGKVTRKVDNRKLPDDPEKFSTKNIVRAGQDLGQFVDPTIRVQIGNVPVEPKEE